VPELAAVALDQYPMAWAHGRNKLFPDEQSRIIKLMIEKIIVKPDNIDIRLWENGIERLALEITLSWPLLASTTLESPD
jgi:hypothetical protein